MVAILQARFIGDVVPLKILRGGEEKKVDVTLKALGSRAPGQYDVRPPFVIVGGLLFQPLSPVPAELGRDLKDAPRTSSSSITTA